jgi:hypothetical protein
MEEIRSWKTYSNLLKYLVLLLVSIGSTFAKAPLSKEQVRIYALEKDWAIYDNQLKEYVPFLPSLHTREKQLYLTLEYQKYKGFYLSLLGDKETYLFINNNLCHYFGDSQWLHLNIDSLQRTIKQTPLLITYLSKKSILQMPAVGITLEKKVETEMVNYQSEEKILVDNPIIKAKPKKKGMMKDFLMLTTLGILAVMAVFSKTTKPIFSFSFVFNSLGDFVKGKNQIKRLSTPSFLFFLLYYGLTLAFVVLFLSTYTDKISYQYFFEEAKNLFDTLKLYVLLSVLMIGFLMIDSLLTCTFRSSWIYHKSFV